MIAQTTDLNIQEAVDRVMIQDLVSRYAFFGDHGPCEDWVALFAPQGRWEMPPGNVFAKGHEAIRKVISSVLEKAPGIHHMQSNLVVDIDGDKARGRVELNAFMLRPGRIYSIAQGWYEDEYVKINGRWYFEVRRVHLSEASMQVQTSGEIGELMKPMYIEFAKQFGQ